MTTDTPAHASTSRDMMQLVGYDMSRGAAANAVYEAAGVGPEDVDVVELHDCFAHNELISYEALGLCAEGGADGVHRRRRQHLRRQGRHQSVGRPAVEGPPARRDRPRAVLRADAPAARQRRARARSRARASRCSTTSGSAAPAWSRCTNHCTEHCTERCIQQRDHSAPSAALTTSGVSAGEHSSRKRYA